MAENVQESSLSGDSVSVTGTAIDEPGDTPVSRDD